MPGPGNRTLQHLTAIGQQPGTTSRASKWDEAHCQTVTSLAQIGKWPETWAATIGVTFRTMRNWAEEHPEFREALVMGRYLVASYYAEQFQANYLHPNFKASPFLLMLRTRLPELWGKEPAAIWTELGLTGQEEVLSVEERTRSMSDRELEERLNAYRARQAAAMAAASR